MELREMVPERLNDTEYPIPRNADRGGLFRRVAPPDVSFPIQSVRIDWDRLIAKRPLILETVDQMPVYLLKPEILGLLDAEKDPTYRLILDLMWTTGARISEVLALRTTSFVDDGYGFGVILKTLKQRPGRPSKAALQRSPKRYVPIVDLLLQDRIQSYLYAGRFKKTERIFPMARQTVNRHIQALVERVGGAEFPISSHTFRHSFAVHLLLHGRPLKVVSQLLGHRSIDSTEIYTNVLTVDAEHFLDGVDFH
ncbi:MAG: site-specific integrase [Candidatus Thiodiazotropha taylori]|uniref:Site-specific integrase n=1 Tax=Candidatus Thiodiazotropha taylori TaxID=2792791 RepID=A0A9E4N513_9GAMM|nr:site-specific integrase [Candidatus Thiodiazotropha taylori]MCW4256870.1 site-specific integrase [Candidatus Thiodiazotropha taylori]